jgi:ribosomal protein S19
MLLMVIASFERMEAIMNILVGLNWQNTNGRKFTKLQVLRVAVGCAGDMNMTARSIRKRLGGLFGNQCIMWSI